MNSELANYANVPHWSFSSLNTLLNICSLQWYFKYIEKRQSESTSLCLLFGGAFHDGASLVAEHRRDGLASGLGAGLDMFRKIFMDKIRSLDRCEITQEELGGHLCKGESMLKCLDESWPLETVIDIGRAFSIELPNSERRLVGEIDLIVKDNENHTVLVDWKTASTKWSRDKADKDMQATLYSYAMEREFTNPLFRYDVITKAKTPVYTALLTQRSRDDYARALKLIEQADQMVKHGVFYPNETSFSCSSCSYASACRDWHRNHKGDRKCSQL